MKKAFPLLISLFVLLSLLTIPACSSPSEPGPTPSPGAAAYPMAVTDFLGRSVEIPAHPLRIVTTHPAATEMLYGVNGTAVGCDSSSQYPADVQALPKVGSAMSISTEAISALNPDIIFIEALTQERLVDSLNQLGVPIIALRATSLDDITRGLTLTGQITGAEDAAAQAITGIQSKIELAQGNCTGNQTVLILISDSQRNIYAAKPESYAGGIAALLHLGNPATGLPDTGPYPGFTLFTGEQALTSNPDIIFTITPAPTPAPRLSTTLQQAPGFNQMAAVQAGHVIELDPMLFLQAPGPRIGDAAEELARLVNGATP